jgi:anthranilate synthase component 1
MSQPELDLQPSREEFASLTTRGNVIPVWAELTADYETPLSAFEKIADGGPRFLFESAEMTSHAGRYSFMGAAPRAIISAKGKTVTIQEGNVVRSFETQSNPLRDLEAYMSAFKPVPSAKLPVFSGGAVGYLAYDMVQFFEPTIGAPPPDVLGLPDMVYLLADTLVIFDHRYRTLQVVANVVMADHVDLDAAYTWAGQRITCTPCPPKPCRCLQIYRLATPRRMSIATWCAKVRSSSKQVIFSNLCPANALR